MQENITFTFDYNLAQFSSSIPYYIGVNRKTAASFVRSTNPDDLTVESFSYLGFEVSPYVTGCLLTTVNQYNPQTTYIETHIIERAKNSLEWTINNYTLTLKIANYTPSTKLLFLDNKLIKSSSYICTLIF